MAKKRKLKKGILGKCFRILSIIFVLGCCIYYGNRLIKYYKIYNPKQSSDGVVSGDLLYSNVPKISTMVSSGDGLYMLSGSYVYKGNVTNNYIKFSNKMFRIVKINSDGTTEIALDENLDAISYSDKFVNYNESSIKKYLDDKFLNKLNKNMLIKFGICLDKITNVQALSCNEIGENYYVRSLDLATYINSIVDNKTYLSDDDEDIWLSNISEKMVWYINMGTVKSTSYDEKNKIKPIVVLKSSTKLKSGTGTLKDPYIIKED